MYLGRSSIGKFCHRAWVCASITPEMHAGIPGKLPAAFTKVNAKVDAFRAAAFAVCSCFPPSRNVCVEAEEAEEAAADEDAAADVADAAADDADAWPRSWSCRWPEEAEEAVEEGVPARRRSATPQRRDAMVCAGWVPFPKGTPAVAKPNLKSLLSSWVIFVIVYSEVLRSRSVSVLVQPKS
jgi:hypothetical protein